MRRPHLVIVSLALMGCSSADNETGEMSEAGEDAVVDADGDGTPSGEDCDDSAPARNRVDGDADGVSPCDGDCDDENAAAYPGAAAQEPALCTVDGDGDGYGSAVVMAPLEQGTDCDDDDEGAYPGDEEVWYDGIDQDCAGGSDFDADEDGYDSDLHGGTDCDDTTPVAYPDADESLLGGDLDCDGSVSNQLVDSGYLFVADDLYIGSSVSSAGDVDGDGLADVLVSATSADDSGENASAVFLFLGKSLGEEGAIRVEDADYTFLGEAPDDQAGCSVAGVGDVDGDGLDDLLIGANDYGMAIGDLSRAYLLLRGSLGVPGDVELADADYVFVAEGPRSDDTAQSVAGPGDVDGYWIAGILIGAGTNGEGGSAAGKAYVILASSLGDTREINAADADYGFIGQSRAYTGSYVTGAGYVDDDGLGDILVTAAHTSEVGCLSSRARGPRMDEGLTLEAL